MLSTSNGQTPNIEVRPFARAAGNTTDGDPVEDWRPPELPYYIGPELRMPLEDLRTGGESNSPPPTEDTCRAIERLVINGSSIAAAKSLVGIRSNLWGEWVRHARAGKYPWNVMMERLEIARKHVEATCTSVIRSAAVHPDPKVAVPAAIKTLEYTGNPRYQSKNRQDVNVKVKASLDRDSLGALTALLAAPVEALAALATVLPTAPTAIETTAVEEEEP